jgi:hypothetical protein
VESLRPDFPSRIRITRNAAAQNLSPQTACRICVHFFSGPAFFGLSTGADIVSFYQSVNLSMTHPTKASHRATRRHKKMGGPSREQQPHHSNQRLTEEGMNVWWQHQAKTCA